MEWKEARGRRRKPKLCPTFTALNQLVLRVQRNIIKRHSQNLRLITSASKMISRNIFTNIDIRPKLFYMLSTTERDQAKMSWRKKSWVGVPRPHMVFATSSFHVATINRPDVLLHDPSPAANISFDPQDRQVENLQLQFSFSC